MALLVSASSRLSSALQQQQGPAERTTTKKNAEIAVVARPAPLQQIKAAAAATLCSALLAVAQPAAAELSKFEYEAGGEFGKGTALQFGEADIKGKDFHGQDLQRSNFTSADARDANFSGAKLQATFFMKAVLARANMENADLSDALMDRAVIVDANLRNAILQRTILTRSDLTNADVYGADFTGSLVDKLQQQALCKYADGVNTVTGVSTRKSLACGSSRRFKAISPSDPEGPQVSEAEKAAFNATTPIYRQ